MVVFSQLGDCFLGKCIRYDVRHDVCAVVEEARSSER